VEKELPFSLPLTRIKSYLVRKWLIQIRGEPKGLKKSSEERAP